MEDHKMFLEYMAGFGELHNKELSDVLVDMYWKSLQPFTDEQCKIAFDKAVVKCRFFPKPVDLIEIMEVPKEYIAQQQAGYFVQLLQGLNYRNPPGWDEDPTTKRLLDGRFKNIYQRAMVEDIKWLEKDFIEAYQDIAEYVENDEKLRLEAPEEIKKLARGIG